MLIPVRLKAPKRFKPGLVGPQIPRTDILTVATSITVVTLKVPGIQFHAFAIDSNYGKGQGLKQRPKDKPIKLKASRIDWDNLRLD